MSTLLLKDDEYILEINNRSDMDLKLVYNPTYFETVMLKSEMDVLPALTPTPVSLSESHSESGPLSGSLSEKIVGGYFQDTEKLTVPFKYLVYMIEKNPLSIGLHKFIQTITPKSDVPNKPAPTTQFSISANENGDKSTNVGFMDKITNLFKPNDDTLKKIEPEPTTEDNVIDEPVIEETAKEEPVIVETVIQEPLPEYNVEKITITFDAETNIDHNGKNIKAIANELKQKERTIEDFSMSGFNYLLLERITFDLYSQKTYLYQQFNMIYSEFREEFIYNINGRYVLVDAEKLQYLGTDTSANSTANSDNNLLFIAFIQKIQDGGDSILQTSESHLIENTNVDKLLNMMAFDEIVPLFDEVKKNSEVVEKGETAIGIAETVTAII